jgi:hypothetical protein
MPLVALLGLVHLRVTLARAVLGRTGCRNQGGVHHRALFEQQAFGGQRGVDGGQDLNADVVGFEQVAKAQDGALIGEAVFPHIQSRELTKHRGVVQRFFHGGVRQVEPLLEESECAAWSTANGGRPPLVPGCGACGAISDTSSAHGTTRFISSRNSRLRVRLVLRSNPLSLRLICFMASTLHFPCQWGGFAEVPENLDALQGNYQGSNSE